MTTIQDPHQSSPSELLERLRKGQVWLTRTKSVLFHMENAGVGAPLEEQFNLAFITWACYETAYRAVTGSAACIMGFECDPESPILCERCKK